MDPSATAFDVALEDGFHADRMRLDSFRLGTSRPASMNNFSGPKSSHARSHSRNGSVSIPLAFPTPFNPLPSGTTTTDELPESLLRHSVGAAKRSSHHHRRSSVSTRRESADMMGVTLPSIPASLSDDNINLGDKDSIRRRALWTLEGKTDVGSFSKVEIPEFSSPDSTRPFEFPTKPSYPPGNGGGLSSLIGGKRDSLGSKRDSLGKFMSSSSTREQLDTLLEEEEEEEETVDDVPTARAAVEVTITSPSPSRAPSRPRPATLNLRPLSLVSGSIIDPASGDLPTPVLTPSPNPRPGLRSLTLGSAVAAKRQSLILTQSPSPLSNTFARRPSLNLKTSAEVGQQSFPQPSRRSSIPYVCSTDTPPQSVIGLPTPEMTPITAEREPVSSSSGSGTSEEVEQFLVKGPSRPLSASEQHFLFQAHATLVQRISDLERALSSRSSRSHSRPTSFASDVSSAVSVLSEPSDEMLQLIADLKAERDEFKKDVDGWRVRVGDLERQVGILAKRVDTERRDAWVARERVSLLEMEKSSLEQALSDKTMEVQQCQTLSEQAKTDVEKVQAEYEKLKAEMERMRGVEEECAELKAAFADEKKRREELERDLEHAGLLNTPRAFDAKVSQPLMNMSRSIIFAKRGLGFQSMDSEGSFTDVESVDSPRDKHEFGLKSVAEEDEETISNYSEDDELARFEDEEEGDAFAFPTSTSASSFGSVNDRTYSPAPLQAAVPEPTPALTRSNTTSPSPLPSSIEQTHERRASLSKTWTFPAGTAPAPTLAHPDEIDRFFGCLEDVDNSPPMHARVRSLDGAKKLFAQALAVDDDELPPFVLPSDVGVEVSTPEIKEEERKHVLDVVIEEEEEEEIQEESPVNPDDEFVGEVDEGGIKFTFTIPPEYQENLPTSPDTVSSPNTSSSFSFDYYEEEDSSFTFPQARQRNTPSPSSIPRLASNKLTLSTSSGGSATPSKSSSVLRPRSNNVPAAFSTPPSKRGGVSPKFTPQPRIQAGSKPKNSTASNVKPASFIPQPKRVPVPASPKSSVMSPTTDASISSPRSAHAIVSKLPSSSSTMTSHALPESASGFSHLPSKPSPQSPSSPSSLMSMSPTSAARLSFQTITNFISLPSLSWSPRSTSTATVAAALCFVPDSASRSSSVSDTQGLEHSRAASSFINPAVQLPSPQPVHTQAKEKTFVPREKQLEKLRIRMEAERRMRTHEAQPR